MIFAPRLLLLIGLFSHFSVVQSLVSPAKTNFDDVAARRNSRLSYQSETTSENDDDLLQPYEQRPTTSNDDIRRHWIDSSIQYYSKVSREERRRNLGQINVEEYDERHYSELAKKHYFALQKAKYGKPEHAEQIYRRIIHELLQEDEDKSCDHAQLAVTTLLLALHVQRSNGDPKKTRSVFLNFFRRVVQNDDPQHQCACSAKVLQAFALFEMKQGNELKSLDIVCKAVRLDPTLRPVLNWKQFRNVLQRRKERRRAYFAQQKKKAATTN